MMTTKTATEYAPITQDFGICDEKGRVVGGQATFQQNYKWDQETWSCAYLPGVLMYVQATRNGQKYGAVQPSRFYPDYASAVAAASGLLSAQRARYAKKYAK